MKLTIGRVALAFAFAMAIAVSSTATAQTAAEKAKIEKMSKYIATIGKKLAGNNEAVKSTSMNWPENPEVKEVAAFSDAKRIGALWELVHAQRSNEEKAFPNAKDNQEQLALSLLNRLLSFSKYQSFLGNSSNDVIVKDYVDGEIADLKMVFSDKMPVGLYFKSRKIREDKYDLLTMQDKEIVTEILTFKMSKSGKLEALATKTFMISLLESCYQNMDVCAKLAGK